jgi:hypothetical protein
MNDTTLPKQQMVVHQMPRAAALPIFSLPMVDARWKREGTHFWGCYFDPLLPLLFTSSHLPSNSLCHRPFLCPLHFLLQWRALIIQWTQLNEWLVWWWALLRVGPNPNTFLNAQIGVAFAAREEKEEGPVDICRKEEMSEGTLNRKSPHLGISSWGEIKVRDKVKIDVPEL